MKSIEFRDMRYVMEVCEERSFSRAAEKLFISQPALSKIIRRAEKTLGTQIFDRGSFPLKITPEGMQIVEYFRRLLEVESELEQYCGSLRKERPWDLTVAAPSFFCTYMLPPIVSAFQEEYEECEIKLMETNDRDLREFLKAGAADFGVSVDEGIPPELMGRELSKEMIVLAVPAESPVNRELAGYALKFDDMVSGRIKLPEIPAVPMERFSEERFLFLRPGNDMYRRGMKICHDAGFSPKIVMELDQLLTAYHLALAGKGAALVRSSIPGYTGCTERLCFYKIESAHTVRSLFLFYRRSLEMTPMQKNFIDFLEHYPLPG